MNKIKQHPPETLQGAIQSMIQDSPASHLTKMLVHKQLEVSAVQQANCWEEHSTHVIAFQMFRHWISIMNIQLNSVLLSRRTWNPGLGAVPYICGTTLMQHES